MNHEKINETTLKNFSIYNNHRYCNLSLKNPLRDLEPRNKDHGWHVARNLIKPLNHLEFLRRKEEIAEMLKLHNIRTAKQIFNMNYICLKYHQNNTLSTSKIINYLVRQNNNNEKGEKCTKDQFLQLLHEYATICHMEFHPTDLCNLSCYGCTYGHDNKNQKSKSNCFPFKYVNNISKLKPKSIVIVGGGEPTLYNDNEKNKKFEDLVYEIVETNPGVKLALVTNGTYKPEGNWPILFDWIRITLDASTVETYKFLKGKNLYRKVIENFLKYLDYDVKYVGIAFLFSKYNIHEYASIAKFIFDLVMEVKPQYIHKVNIQYRPLRRDPFHYKNNFKDAITIEQINKTVFEIKTLSESSKEMKNFLRNQTNITAVLGGNYHLPLNFSRCYYSQTFRIIRSNGELRPCFIRVNEHDFILGNLITDSLEKIALNTLYIGACRKRYCDANSCRQCHVNYIFEKALEGTLHPSKSKDVLSDPMY